MLLLIAIAGCECEYSCVNVRAMVVVANVQYVLSDSSSFSRVSDR